MKVQANDVVNFHGTLLVKIDGDWFSTENGERVEDSELHDDLNYRLIIQEDEAAEHIARAYA